MSLGSLARDSISDIRTLVQNDDKLAGTMLQKALEVTDNRDSLFIEENDREDLEVKSSTFITNATGSCRSNREIFGRLGHQAPVDSKYNASSDFKDYIDNNHRPANGLHTGMSGHQASLEKSQG